MILTPLPEPHNDGYHEDHCGGEALEQREIIVHLVAEHSEATARP
jgi:hypothetical protein